jgi:hypothetical protein
MALNLLSTFVGFVIMGFICVAILNVIYPDWFRRHDV